MVRKSTRSNLRTEKIKVETPKRNRTRASARLRKSSSDESDEEVKDIPTRSPSKSERNSSEDESPDRDSKKPFKKRIRGRNRGESPVVDQSEEVKEEKKSKGKSKGKNKSNSYTADDGTESDNIQVTNESPSRTKEEQQTVDSYTEQIASDAVTTGERNIEETETEKMQPFETDIVTEKDSNTQEENLISSTETEEQTTTEVNEYIKDQSELSHEEAQVTSEIVMSESTKNQDNSKYQPEEPGIENKTEQTQDLEEPMSPKNLGESSKEIFEKKEEGKKKITLKRLTEVKKPVAETKDNKPDSQEVSAKNDSEKDLWVSTYETKPPDQNENQKSTEEKSSEPEDKIVRKRISLKRPTIEEKKEIKAPEPKNDITSLERSSSLQDHRERKKSETESSSLKEIRRRHSTAFESPTKENEEKLQRLKKPTKTVKLIRSLNRESEDIKSASNIANKTSKWAISDLLLDVEVLNLGSLREICTDIELLPESELNLEIVIKETKASEKERQKSFNEMEAEEMEKIEAELNAEPEDFQEKENIIAMNRKISIVDDTASKLKPPPSPAKNAVSDVLFITNLVRPFTVKQLRELLERTGKIQEEGFWTDRIKSKCYVHYDTVEEAEATRNALHGVHWPIGNGKKLIIDYATVEDLETAKNPPVVVRQEKTPEKENKKPEKEEPRIDRNGDRTVTREWEGNKDANYRKKSRSRSRDRPRKHSRRSYTPEDYHSKKKKRDEPVPQKAMDDLFLKTKATPSIYWQPLCPEEIALKQQQRQARLEENKRRMEEIRSSGRRDQQRERGRDQRNFRRR